MDKTMALNFVRIVCIALLLAHGGECGAAPDDLIASGVVVDVATGSPMQGVTVAVFDDRGEVVGTDVTDGDGLWAVPVEWDHSHLKAPPSRGGLFSALVGVVIWPVRMASDIIITPAGSALKGAIRAAGGAAAAGASVAALAGAGPVATAAAGAAAKTVGSYAAGQVVGEDDGEQEGTQRDTMKPVKGSLSGQVRVRAWKSGHKDYSGVTGVYRLDQLRLDEDKVAPLALCDAVALASLDSPLASSAPRVFGIFTRVSAEPAITAAGSEVRLTADIALPEELLRSVWMIARNQATRETFEMKRTGGTRWEASIPIPSRGPFRNHEVTIVAYRSPLEDGGRDKGAEGRIEDRGGWDPKKPFPVDPALLACRNRGYAVITVTKPEQGRK